MQYIKPDVLDKLSDNATIYVNRNALNTMIAEYEINEKYSDCKTELGILLAIWDETYKSEKQNNRISMFIQMTNKKIKQCFKNYKNLPLGSFCIIDK